MLWLCTSHHRDYITHAFCESVQLAGRRLALIIPCGPPLECVSELSPVIRRPPNNVYLLYLSVVAAFHANPLAVHGAINMAVDYKMADAGIEGHLFVALSPA